MKKNVLLLAMVLSHSPICQAAQPNNNNTPYCVFQWNKDESNKEVKLVILDQAVAEKYDHLTKTFFRKPFQLEKNVFYKLTYDGNKKKVIMEDSHALDLYNKEDKLIPLQALSDYISKNNIKELFTLTVTNTSPLEVTQEKFDINKLPKAEEKLPKATESTGRGKMVAFLFCCLVGIGILIHLSNGNRNKVKQKTSKKNSSRISSGSPA